jgi:hypothetical protein
MKESEPKPNGKIHPLAAMWPKFGDDDMAALVQSIKANGLREPIVLDQDGTLLEGVNRQEACKRAEVKPRYVTLNGDTDVVAFIFDRNAHRRMMTKGQIAMIAVKSDPPEVLESSNLPYGYVKRLAERSGASRQRIGHAAVIYRYAGELVDHVIQKDQDFDVALKRAEERRDAAVTEKGQLGRLEAEAPDIAQSVKEEKLKLPEAWAAVYKRRELKRAQQEEITRKLCQCVGFLNPRAYTTAQQIEEICRDFTESMATEEISAELLETCTAVLNGITKYWKKTENVGTQANKRIV